MWVWIVTGVLALAAIFVSLGLRLRIDRPGHGAKLWIEFGPMEKK
jgi:hypothetical protein